jgi:hypothetical protein
MRIEYRANGMQREVRDSVGEVLIARNLATRVYRTRQLVADEPVEISPRTGKSKRKYKRRDLAAED